MAVDPGDAALAVVQLELEREIALRHVVGVDRDLALDGLAGGNRQRKRGLGDDLDARAVIAGAMVMVWALRLGSFLFRRIRRDGKDGRFDAIKTDPLRFYYWPVLGRLYRRRVELCLARLSGGERQRVIFARALAQDAGVLMLDEATASLDIRHTLELLGLSRRRVQEQQQTVIAVFQDINLAAMYCDELLFMKDGEIALQGPTADVVRADTLLSIYGVEGRIRTHSLYGLPQVDFNR